MNEASATYQNVQNEGLRNDALRDALLLGVLGTAGAGAAGAYLGGKARGKTVRTIEEILRSIPDAKTWQWGGAAALGIPLGLSTAAAAAANRLGYDDEKSPVRGAIVGGATGGISGGIAGELVRKGLLNKSPALGIGRAATTVPLALIGLGLGGAAGAGAGFIQRARARKQIKHLLNDVGAEEQA